MSLRASVRAFPTLLRVGFSEAVAYRARLLMIALAVSRAVWNASIARYNERWRLA